MKQCPFSLENSSFCFPSIYIYTHTSILSYLFTMRQYFNCMQISNKSIHACLIYTERYGIAHV